MAKSEKVKPVLFRPYPFTAQRSTVVFVIKGSKEIGGGVTKLLIAQRFRLSCAVWNTLDRAREYAEQYSAWREYHNWVLWQMFNRGELQEPPESPEPEEEPRYAKKPTWWREFSIWPGYWADKVHLLSKEQRSLWEDEQGGPMAPEYLDDVFPWGGYLPHPDPTKGNTKEDGSPYFVVCDLNYGPIYGPNVFREYTKGELKARGVNPAVLNLDKGGQPVSDEYWLEGVESLWEGYQREPGTAVAA